MGLIQSILNALRFNRRNWKAVLLSIVAATLFWFFNALNKTHSANITFPLQFEYDEEKYIPVSLLPDRIRINATGVGWELFWKSSGLKGTPLIIPLERPTEIKKIVGSSLSPLFSTQLEGLQINYVLTDTLYLDLDVRGHKKVALQLDSADRLIARGYIRSGATVIEPDTVVVSGPAKLLAALPSAIDLMVPETKLRSSLKETIEVPLPHPALTVSPPLVNVFVPVEEALEQAVPIQVVIRDIPAGYKPVIDVEKVTCYFQVPASFADTLSFRGVEATISLKDVPRGTHKILPTLSKLPPYIRLVRTDTLLVKF
jgi:hypothetical protein